MSRRRSAEGSAHGFADNLRRLENVQRAAREWTVDVEQVKPCVAQIREVEKGERDLACYILCTELRRVGLPQDRALSVALRWNKENLPPLTVEEVETKVKSAYKGEKTYGCNGPLSQWCSAKGECPFYARFVAGKQPVPGRTTAADFDRLGWRSPHVTPAERIVYRTIERLERLRDVGPGGTVITSTRQLAGLAGLSASGVLQILRFFEAMVLIDYVPGRPRATGLPPAGCKIWRVIPIPDPTTRNPGCSREVRRRLRQPRKPTDAVRAGCVGEQEHTPEESSTCTQRAAIGRRVGIDTFTNGKEEESNAKLDTP